jgi:Fe-Mn family superoxide dismutase
MTEIKPLKYQSLDGLSEKQLQEHHDVLYAGYCKKVDEIRSTLKEASKENVNATFAQWRELNTELTFALNAVKLHEAYFANLGGNGEPTADILNFIEQDFGSVENYKADLLASGMGARGWVVTAYDLDDNHLYNFSCDAHNIGCIWNAIPLLVLDVYEHAYFLDYATNRKSYLENFWKNIDFDYINSRLAEFELAKRRSQLKAS